MRELERLKERLAEISDLQRVATLLAWDQETLMPSAGGAARAEQRATIVRTAHELLVADELGRLLEALRPLVEELPHDSDDASLIRVARRDHEKACRVPAKLRAELSRAGSLGIGAWLEARERRDYGVLLPHLERQLELRRRYVECFGPVADPYDVLLDDYEPGATTAEVAAVLDRLKRELLPLVDAVREVDDGDELRGPFPLVPQRAFVDELLRGLGWDERSWRLDSSEHPFTAGVGVADVRITTRLREDDLGGVFAAMHEFGHGLYERQIAPELARTLLGAGASSALHESQSRLWENLVGRSCAFWSRWYPPLREACPEALGGVDLDRFVRAVNRVRPSLVRVDADEATYNLHIVLRFELERDVLAGRLPLAELPEAFEALVHDYLGLEVPDVRLGVLQDMHWADASFGYFPTYSLGNVISVQLWERARADLPDLDTSFEAGDYGPLRDWLRERLHRYGRKLRPAETVERAAGGPIDPEPYIRYLKGKVAETVGARV